MSCDGWFQILSGVVSAKTGPPDSWAVHHAKPLRGIEAMTEGSLEILIAKTRLPTRAVRQPHRWPRVVFGNLSRDC